MADTPLEKFNKARERMGLPPVTELPSASNNGKPAEQLTEEQKAEIESKKREADEAALKLAEKAKKKEAEDAVEKLKKQEADRKAKEELEKNKQPEITDDVVAEYLRKNKGLTLSSLDDLKKKPTAEDTEKEKEEREKEKWAYGITKVFSKKEYDAYTADVANKNELVFQASFAAAKQDDPELKEDEYRLEFNDKYGINDKPESRSHKEGQRVLNNLANNIIQQRHSKILKLDEVYSNYENEENSRKSSQIKILANAPAYKRDVDEVVSSLANVKVRFDENDEHDVPVSAEALQNVRNTLTSENFAAKKIAAGWTKDEISEIAEMLLWKEDRNNVIVKSAELYHKTHAAGTRGIPNNRTELIKTDNDKLDEKLKLAAQRHGALPAAENPN